MSTLDLATRKLVARAVMDGDVGRALRLLAAVGVDVVGEVAPRRRRASERLREYLAEHPGTSQREAAAALGIARSTVQRHRTQSAGLEVDRLEASIGPPKEASTRPPKWTDSGPNEATESGPIGPADPSPLSHSPLSPTPPLGSLIISSSSGSSGDQGPSLEGGAAPQPEAAPEPAPSGVRFVVLRAGEPEGTITRERFAEHVAAACLSAGRRLDAGDTWERFLDHVAARGPELRTYNADATARSFIRERLKFDRLDAERARSARPVQPARAGERFDAAALERTEELLAGGGGHG